MEAVPAGQLQHLTSSNKVLMADSARLTSRAKHLAAVLYLLHLLLSWLLF
jgi:hypothetical protein